MSLDSDELKKLESHVANLLVALEQMQKTIIIHENPHNPKVVELESHFIRLLDALVELEERITSLEKSRSLSFELNNKG